MVRAMLQPLAGDLRYGAVQALPDQSVALHACAVQLPTTKTTTATSSSRSKKPFQLGSLTPGQVFVTDIPRQWNPWFGIPLGIKWDIW